MQSETFIKSVQLISKFPQCSFRVGRVWDILNEETGEYKYRAVPTCGGKHEISVGCCIKCGGFTNPMLKNKIKDFSRDGFNLLKCELDKKHYNHISCIQK